MEGCLGFGIFLIFFLTFTSRTPWALKGYRCKEWSSPLTVRRGGGCAGEEDGGGGDFLKCGMGGRGFEGGLGDGHVE